MTKLSIIIPAYNEKETIKKILDLIEKVNLEGVEKEIVIVDDGSTDGTKEILTGLKERTVSPCCILKNCLPKYVIIIPHIIAKNLRKYQ